MATVSRSIYLVSGGGVNNNFIYGTQFFTTAANQYAILMVYYPGPNPGNIGIYTSPEPSVIMIQAPSSISTAPYQVYVPPGTIVEAEGVGGLDYALTWIIYETT
jgi:hypothetical protein